VYKIRHYKTVSSIVSCIGWVGSNFFPLVGPYWVGLGWVSQLMGWVGSGHTK